ncbi:Leucine-rich repeat-containing protein 45 [Chytriomyces hyalinus]|nr:Leucine-rich repeat-containing protein 45 [Chytriomyces hyalinus]
MFAQQFEAECNVLGACESAVSTIKGALKAASIKREKEGASGNELVLQGLCIDGKALTALCSVLSKDVVMTRLCLADTFLGDDGAILISGVLKKNTTITTLDLRGNNIRSDGAIALAQMLKMNASLKNLMLEWNCLGIWETGIKALADAFSVNDALEVLDLRNCKLSPQGVNMLSLGLKNNKSLLRLDLRWNNAGLVGGRGLLQCFKSNHTLFELLLTGNEIPEDLLRAIESCIERNASRHKTEEQSKMNSDFLTNTFQHLAASHQSTIETLSTKLELSKENAADTSGKLAAVLKELKEANEAKQKLETHVEEFEVFKVELQKQISGLQRELLEEKEKTSSLEYENSKAHASYQVRLNDMQSAGKELDLQVSVLKKDKALLLDELDKAKRREHERMELNAEKANRAEQNHQKRMAELEADKERELLERCRLFEDRIREIELSKARLVEQLDRSKSDFMLEKHKLMDTISETEVKIRNDEAKRRQSLELELQSFRALKDKIQEELSAQISLHSASLRDHEAEVHSLNQAKMSLNDQLSKLEHMHSKTVSELRSIQSEHETTMKTVKQCDERNHSLEKKLDKSLEEIDHLKRNRGKEHDAYEKAINERDAIIAKLREDLKRIEDEMDEEREQQDLRMKEISLQIAAVLAQRQKSGRRSNK